MSDTRTRLLEAAMSEFIEAGYAGTDTNRIARRAGFAPQTFYRWFKDKAAVMAEVLAVWDEAEIAMWRAVIHDEHLSAAELAEACIDNIRPFLTFRLNLRAVLQQVPDIAAQRAQGRRQLMNELAPLVASHLDPEHLGSLLVQIDQLGEAIARGELQDMGLTGMAAQETLAKLIVLLRGNH
jgi:AcrR family transcriptional regulator